MKNYSIIWVNFFFIMNVNFIPTRRSDFYAWQLNFVDKVNTYKVDWNFTVAIDAEWTLLTNTVAKKKKDYEAKWAIVSTKQATKAQRQAFKDALQKYVSGDKQNPADTSIRFFINRWIRNNPAVTHDQKVDIGITLPDEIPTPTPNAEMEMGQVETNGVVRRMTRLTHDSKISITGQKTYKLSDDVDAVEVHIAFTEATAKVPPEPKAYVHDGDADRGHYVRQFKEEEDGLRAWYKSRTRMKGKKKSYGTFSQPWSAVIS